MTDTFVSGLLLSLLLSTEQIILGIRSSEVFTVLLAFFPLSSIGTIFTLILRRVSIFSLKIREYFSRPNV